MKAENSPHVSALIEKFVPSHIISSYPELIDFLRAYLDFLESSHGAGYYQNALPAQRDIERQEEEFLTRIEKEIGLFVPRQYASTPRVFYNKITELWRSKGTQEAVETFFRLFLDDPVQVRYPWDRVLKPSDGRWIVENKLRVTMISGNGMDFLGQSIVQNEEFATSKVKKVEREVYSDAIIYELTLSEEDTIGDFKFYNTITIPGSTGIQAEIYKSAVGLKILDGGRDYRVGDRIRVDNFDGVTFSAFVSRVSETGAIQDIRFSNFGAGNTPLHIKANAGPEDRVYVEDFRLYQYSTNDVVSFLFYKIDTVRGSDAEFEIEYGALAQTEGNYVDSKGQLSDAIVLQDSRFFQKYSYEVITSFSSDRWVNALKRTVHPAGVAVFGNIRVYNELNMGVESATYINKFTPDVYIFGENPGITETLIGFSQDYAINSDAYFLDDYTGQVLFEQETQNQTQPPLDSETVGLA